MENGALMLIPSVPQWQIISRPSLPLIEFLPNIAWSIGNGGSIDLLNDIWVPSLGPLHDYLNNPLLLTDGLYLKDFVAENATWDYNALCDLFSASIVDRILSIKCPELCDSDDRCMWRWTANHTFEFRSAYSRPVGSSWSPKQAIWPIIWRMHVPQYISLFLWMAYTRKLLTNAERCRRHLSTTSTCVVCTDFDETIMHVLRDCGDTRHLWRQLLPMAIKPPFFSMNLQSDEAFFKRSLAWANHYYACAAVGEKRCPARMQWHRNCLVDALIKLVDPSVPSLCVYFVLPPEVVLFLDVDKACL
ncbi:hypothetical protein V6N12_035317 [Hibiscus sabdariffa]|uniref:Reverse transcriptase zinc-binding domain-containing protein n=1 Tax=Hibiscus sabdariffa TaxID=183260 RepID=A0ABR2BST8_9ROSI